MGPGLFQILVIVGLVFLFFGTRHMGRVGFRLGRVARAWRRGGSELSDVAEVARRASGIKRGFPWLK